MTCEDVAQNPEQLCPSMPWCEVCTICIPGGGGIWRPALSYTSRPLMLEDHGEFAAWTSREVIGAKVVHIIDQTHVDIQITKKDGSYWIERNIRVSRYPWEWDSYLVKRSKYREFYQAALKSAYAEFLALTGSGPLPLLYYNGRVYLPNGPIQPFCRVVWESEDESMVNVFGDFSDQVGVSVFKGVNVTTAIGLDQWKVLRDAWLPILSKWTAIANEQMIAYAGANYLDYV